MVNHNVTIITWYELFWINLFFTYTRLVTLTQHLLVVHHLKKKIPIFERKHIRWWEEHWVVPILNQLKKNIFHLVRCIDKLRFRVPHVVSDVVPRK